MVLTLLPTAAFAAGEIDEQFTLAPGGTYYFELSAMGIPGTVNDALPDKTMRYIPFTYAGTVDAYKMCIRDSSFPASADVSMISAFAARVNLSFADICAILSKNNQSKRQFMKKLKRTYTPVSYTHLDVYKRQGLYTADGACDTGLFA